MTPRDFFQMQGRANRGTYALVGILGVLLKYNIDRILSLRVFHFQWGLVNYLLPLGILDRSHVLSADEKKFLLTTAAVALPFVWVGVVMTVNRLRDAGLNTKYVLLFFAPVVNVLFFLLLCLLPSLREREYASESETGWLKSVLPSSKWGSATVAALAGGLSGTLLSWCSVWMAGIYGLTLFLAIPFFMGFLAAWLHSYREPRSWQSCGIVAAWSVALTGLFIVGLAFEGIFCVLMAAPIAIPLALGGASVAYVVQEKRYLRVEPHALLSLMAVLPLLAGAEFWAAPPTPTYKVHTSIEIAAPPNAVWKRIVAFPPVEENPTWAFGLGISYPIEARLTGTGLSADRRCMFSSGAFREPILAWEQDKHFAFGVTEEPALMKEWSPYGDIHVRHLEDHDFQPQRADFYLTELPGGRTRLDGWTTYQNRMWPGAYWRLWTDAIVHQIHGRVFRHVKRLAEADVRQEAIER